METVIYCKECLYPSLRPSIKFIDGVCSACISYKNRSNINYDERKKELISILEEHKSKDGKNYDCLIPISGGKDSTYQVWYIKNLGYNPLCVMATTCDMTILGRKNIDNIRNNLDVDVLELGSCLQTRHKLNKLSLELIGDPSWPEHTTVYTVSLQIAVKYKISLIVWGEAADEFGAVGITGKIDQKTKSREYQEEFGCLNGLRTQDVCELANIKPNKLLPYMYPSQSELENLNICEIFLGYFVNWDPYKNYIVSLSCGMECYNKKLENSPVNYISMDDYHVNIRDYFKYLKYGYGRYTDHLNQYIRRGIITREESLILVKQYDGPYPHSYLEKSLKDILATIGLTINDFEKLEYNFINRNLFLFDTNGKIIRDDNYRPMLKSPPF